MNYSIDVPLGRSSALLMFAMTTATSLVLILVSFLSQDSDYRIPYFVVYYCWIIILSIATLAAMLAFVLARRKTNHVTLYKQCEHISDGYWIYLLVTILCGLGASMFRWFETVRVAKCIGMMKENYFFLPKFLSELLLGIVWLAELVFFIACRKYECQSSWSRILVSVIVSANVSIFVNGVLDVFRAANTELDSAYSPRTSDNSTNESSDYFKRTLVFSYCNNSTEVVDHLAGKINTYVYHFPLAYCLLALCVLGPMWNVITRSVNRDVINTEADSGELGNLLALHDDTTDTAVIVSKCRLIAILKLSLSVPLKYMSKRPWQFSLAFVLLYFVCNIVVTVINPNDGHGNSNDANSTTLPTAGDAIYYISTITIYIISIVSFFGYLVSRKNNPSRWRYNTKNILLGFGTLGQLLLLFLITVESITGFFNPFNAQSQIADILGTLLSYVGVYCQTMLILKAGGLFNNELVNSMQLQYVKGVVVFLAIGNTIIWLANSFLTLPTPKLVNIEDINGDDIFGHKNWWLLTGLLSPCCLFYRMFSGLMCFELLYKLKMRNRRYNVL